VTPELVERALSALFGSSAEDAARVRRALQTYGVEPHEREADRVRLAILRVSNGDVKVALEGIALAKKDYRDVLVGAEYPQEQRVSIDFLSRRVPLKSPEAQEALSEARRRDRQQYEEWLASLR
jgi:hypothetical protein